ncbi:MAG: hypothetical protein GF317_23625 [Candidatus Lokiarchaeota archaeon]|nr:hypothetical protein [Candidatus Lokiarchaeota archaeon]MBD3202362.1 hypothetical protein [Candidatus Lokiarchaeota archaeon]
MSNHKYKEFIEVFQKVGLNESEAKIYYSLIKAGSKGYIVKELNEMFPDLARTTIYSILRNLEETNFVKDAGSASRSKGAKIYAAIRPIEFFRKLIEKKKNELEKLNELSLLYSDRLENIYNEGMMFSLDDIDERLQPYFAPLLNNNWKLNSYIIEKKTSTINYDFFECVLEAPRKNFYKEIGFLLFLFEYNVAEDDIALKFFMKMIKKKAKEELIYKTDLKNIDIKDTELQIFDHSFPAFLLESDLKNLETSELFSESIAFIKENPEIRKRGVLPLGISVVCPINNKIFVMWGESKERIKPVIEVILKNNS